MPDYTGVGDAAEAAGYPTIDPATGKVRDGGDEINLTRDLIAKVNGRIRYGTATPSNSLGNNLDIYIRYE